MYSKEETQKIKHEFWVSFAAIYPRKWILHDTKIKDFSFKFFADNKKVQVLITIENRNEKKRHAYFEKILSLKNILEDEFIPNLVFEKDYTLENGKCISKIWVEQSGIGITNRADWTNIFQFYNNNMNALELFYHEYDEFIKNIDSSL